MLFAALVLTVPFSPDQPVNAWTRPDSASALFAVLEPGETVELSVRTKDGWTGFDPGTAQAGNSGSFRYRWIAPEASPAGSDSLETVWGPSAGIEYAMTFDAVKVRDEPDSLANIVWTLSANGAAAVLANEGDWLLVDLNQGTEGSFLQGWVHLAEVGISDQ